MKTAYKAYCRAACQLGCNPAPLFLGLVLLLGAFFGGSSIVKHESAIIHGFLIVAATALTAVAGFLLILAMRTVVTARGQHHAPACAVPETPREKVQRWLDEDERAGRVTQPVPGSYTWTIKPPAEAAAMEAEADVLADDETGVVVSSGGIYVLTGDSEDAP